MTSVSGLGSGLLQSYENFKNYKTGLTSENMFQMLSIQLDGDGETITKDQLDTYIESAKDGDIDVSDKELEALTTLQKDWDSIAGKGAKSMTFDDIKGLKGGNNLLLSAVTGGISVPDVTESLGSSAAVDDVDAFLMDSALSFSPNKEKGSGLTSLLQTLLTGTTDEEDDKNADLIATLTNLIADYDSASTVELEA